LFIQLNGSRKVIGVLRGYDVRYFFIALLPPADGETLGIPEYRAR
jgi:hypothetical protein